MHNRIFNNCCEMKGAYVVVITLSTLLLGKLHYGGRGRRRSMGESVCGVRRRMWSWPTRRLTRENIPVAIIIPMEDCKNNERDEYIRADNGGASVIAIHSDMKTKREFIKR
jgi:hypothetical protein